MCQEAASRGLSGIALTDHCDIDAEGSVCFSMIKQLKSDVRQARDILGDKLEISVGIELGEAHHNPALAREITSDGELDFVIGSLHRHRNSQDYYYLDYDHADIGKIMRGYYEELMEMAECGCFDVVGHINYQLRYMSAFARKRIDVSDYYDTLQKILKIVADSGKGIEINTSGLWRGIGYTLPSTEVVRMFREAGGKIVTTGSDSHNVSNVGDCLDGAIAGLKAAGFDRYAFFKKRVPCFHNL